MGHGMPAQAVSIWRANEAASRSERCNEQASALLEVLFPIREKNERDECRTTHAHTHTHTLEHKDIKGIQSADIFQASSV